MAETQEVAGVLQDNSLSDQARIIAIHLINQGEGFHELRYEDLSTLLNGYPSPDTVGKHVRQLVNARVVERKPGGRGHGDQFQWIGRPQRENSPPSSVPPIENSPQPQLPPKQDSPQSAGGAMGGRGGVVVEEEVGTPSKSPPQVHPRAESLIREQSEKLDGCRGPLRDYLAARVPTKSQRSYVGAVLGWLDGLDAGVWQLPDGSKLPPKKRTAVLADALNQLGTADEERQRKWAPGDVMNLKNKIDAILRPKDRPPRRTGGTGGGDRKAGKKRQGVNELWGRTGTDV